MLHPLLSHPLSSPLRAPFARSRGVAFSIALLFAASEQGVWFDPSDLTTMYQDSAGTTPAAINSPVGLILDKSRGLTLGSDLALGAGNPFSDVTQWPISAGAGTRALNAGNLTVTYATSSTAASKSFTVTTTGLYRITYTLSNLSAGTARVLVSNTAAADAGRLVGPSCAANGTYQAHVYLGPGTYWLDLNKPDAGSVDFSAVTNKLVAGNHALQATSTARPILSVRKNLLISSESLATAGSWAIGTGVTVTLDQMTAPDGALAADLLSITSSTNNGAYETSAVLPSTAYTGSVYVKLGTLAAADYKVAFYDATNAAFIATDVVPTVGAPNAAGFVRCSYTVTTPATCTSLRFYVFRNTAVATGTLYLWGAQLEVGSAATTYQRVNTATDYDTVGFPTYLLFDGVDDFLLTGSIDFTGTDKMTVLAAIQTAQTTVGIFSELSDNLNNNGGAFYLPATGDPSGTSWSAGVRGNGAQASGGTFPAKTTPTLLTAILNIAGALRTDELSLRQDGSALTYTGAGSDGSGAGNFGNYPLYLGARAGTSLFFAGRMYGIVARGAATTPTDVSKAEAVLAPKAGVTLP